MRTTTSGRLRLGTTLHDGDVPQLDRPAANGDELHQRSAARRAVARFPPVDLGDVDAALLSDFRLRQGRRFEETRNGHAR